MKKVLEVRNVSVQWVPMTEEKNLYLQLIIKESSLYVKESCTGSRWVVSMCKKYGLWDKMMQVTTINSRYHEEKNRIRYKRGQFEKRAIPQVTFYNTIFFWSGICQWLILKTKRGFLRWSVSSPPLLLALLAVGTKPGLVFRGWGCQAHTSSVEEERMRERERDCTKVWLQKIMHTQTGKVCK